VSPSICLTLFLGLCSSAWPGRVLSQDTPAFGQQQNSVQPQVTIPQQNTVQRQSQNGGQEAVYSDSAGSESRQGDRNGELQQFYLPRDPLTDMQRLASAATGKMLPIYGRDLFQQAPSTFAPADQVPSLPSYVVGPGDQLLVRLWGPESFNGQLTVDGGGSIYIPQVGGIHVAGLRVDELEEKISADIRHTFRNFNLSVNLGHLRSVQVYVVGEARKPGVYTVSSLSTVLNVLFASGGPNVNGSLRRIEVRRGGATIGELDLYDLLLKGDRSKDLRLESNDTIFIPAVGPQVALGGSVNHPAIYELRGETTVGAILELAGGFTPIGLNSEISLERIGEDHVRTAFTVKLDATGHATLLRNGDVLYANHVTAAFEQSVAIRGNLANPGKFAWHPGMRLSEIIPDRQSLLTNDYWQERNKLGLPTPLFEPLNPRQSRQTSSSMLTSQDQRSVYSQSSRTPTNLQQQYPLQQQYSSSSEQTHSGTQNGLESIDALGSGTGTSDRDILAARMRPGNNADEANDEPTLTRGTLADQQQAIESGSLATQGHRTLIKIPAPGIDWSYAVIERLNPDTLRNSLVPFNIGKLIQEHDANQNLELQPGDVVTIVSQTDIHGPQDEQTKYVHLEGEFKGAGVYSVGPNETLDDLIRRAGGLTDKAYLYGASFTRETARVFQQQRLDEYVSQLAISMQRESAVRAASSTTGLSDPNSLAEQHDLIAQFRRLRATGRIVLQFKPDSQDVTSIPHIALEDGDIFRVPSRPATVAVIGAVHGQNVFLQDPTRRVNYYVALAGKPTSTADRNHAFIIRADGSVFSREHTLGSWVNAFDTAPVEPGDAIVIPEKPVRASGIRQFIDYAQIFSQLALGAAAISVIKQ
jgi:polysaccharide export outer membrane protein